MPDGYASITAQANVDLGGMYCVGQLKLRLVGLSTPSRIDYKLLFARRPTPRDFGVFTVAP